MPRHILFAAILFSCFLGSCKDPEGPGGGGNNNGTTPESIGDIVPGKTSSYMSTPQYLDTSGNIILSTIGAPVESHVDSIGMTVLGKDNVFLIFSNDNFGTDSMYFAYEKNGNVSIYFFHPGYTHNYTHFNYIDEPLEGVINAVFQQWITLPIATTDTGIDIYNNKITVYATGSPISADIHAKVSFIGNDSTIKLENGKQLSAKHCKINITALLSPSKNDRFSLTHSRDIWFVPQIGNIAKIMTKTFVPDYNLLVIPSDTTATLKVLTSYRLN
jgi:hypothetical protein